MAALWDREVMQFATMLDIPKEEISKWIQEIVVIQKKLVELENEWKKPIIPKQKIDLLKNLL